MGLNDSVGAGGVSVVTVSGGSGAAVGTLGRGVATTRRVGGGPTVAVVDALSPP